MQAGYPEVVSSEKAKSEAPAVSGEPEGKTAACVNNASTTWALRSRRPRACMETSRARTERPSCHPRLQGGGSVGEGDEL